MVEGYNIYEYKYPKGDIDCYVKKGIATKDALVEYIYYEPKDNIKLVDFIIKDSLRTLIQNKKSEVFYIVDGICNSPVRIRLFRKKRDEISNIALNDMSILKEKKDVSAYIQKNIKSYIPIQMGDLGLLSKIEFNNNELQLFLTVDESSSKRVLDIVKNNPNWESILAIRLFGQYGILSYLENDLIREKVNLSFCLIGEKTGEKVEGIISYKRFMELFKKGISNSQYLSNLVSFVNLILPVHLDENVTLKKMEIEKKMLVYKYSITVVDTNYFIDTLYMKKMETSLLPNVENPDRTFISLCLKCGYGMKKVFYIESNGKCFEITYSPEEVKKLHLILLLSAKSEMRKNYLPQCL